MNTYIKKQYILLAICIFGIFWLSFAIYKELSLIAKTRADISAAKNTLATFNIKNANVATDAARIAVSQKKVAALGGIILAKDTIPPFLSHIESVAAFYGVSVDMGSVDTTTREDITFLTITFSAKGTQGHLQDFFDAVQAQPQAIRFAQLYLSPSAKLVAVSPDKPVVFTSDKNAEWSASGVMEVMSFKQ